MVRIVSIFLVVFALPACFDWSNPVAGDGREDAPLPPELGGDLDLDLPESDCPAGQASCDGLCVDVVSNHDHCGGCGAACEPFEVCADARCALECPAGKIACEGSCVDIESDVLNCGSCGNTCTAGENADPACESRVCTVHCRPGWSDLDGDGACESSCSPSGSEVCNGVDDNCDGLVDEGFECGMGRTVSCTTSCGSTGSGACSLTCSPPPPSECTPPAEICNGIDDDCDGTCDDGFDCCIRDTEFCTTACGTSGMSTCSSTCMWSSCQPPPETCNGVDDDCDRTCDDGFDCCRLSAGSCTTSCGSTGSRACSASCAWESCAPPPETCNGADDDCDTLIDEGYEGYRCPSTGAVFDDSSTCTASCSQTQACSGSTGTVTVSGNVTLQTTDCDGYTVYPPIMRLEGSGGALRVYRRPGCFGSEELAGSLSLSGATVSGSVSLQTTDCDGYTVYPPIMRLEGSGGTLRVYRRPGCFGGEELAGTLTLSGVTTYTCPLGSFPCSGTPPACSAPQACEQTIVCP